MAQFRNGARAWLLLCDGVWDSGRAVGRFHVTFSVHCTAAASASAASASGFSVTDDFTDSGKDCGEENQPDKN